MDRFNETRSQIDSQIKENGAQSITGKVLNSVLNNIVDATEDVTKGIKNEINVIREVDNSIQEILSTQEQQISSLEHAKNAMQENLDVLNTEVESNNVAIEDLQDNKVGKGDYAPHLVVGLSDNLVGRGEPSESEISFRASGGGSIEDGVAKIESIKGNSVVWNQLVDIKYLASSDNGITYTMENGVIVANGTATDTSFSDASSGSTVIQMIPSHKYVYGFADTANTNARLQLFSSSAGNVDLAKSGQTHHLFTYSYGADDKWIVRIRIGGGTSVSNARFRLCLYDLTKMFGAGNEPTTIEEFYQRIPQGVDLNAYNEGEVISMNVQSIKSVGFNAWDEEYDFKGVVYGSGATGSWSDRIASKNFIPVLPSTSYFLSSPIYLYVFFYDADRNYISNTPFITHQEFTTPQNAAYIKFSAIQAGEQTYNNDICINLSHTGYRNGEYEPYTEDSKELSIIAKYFPNGMRSAGTAHDEIYYDRYKRKWFAVQRFGEVGLSTLNWYHSAIGYFASEGIKSKIRAVSSYSSKGNIICSKYTTDTLARIYDAKVFNAIGVSIDGQIAFLDSSITNVGDIASALQGVMLYYELAEPIVTEIEGDFSLDYEVWDFGTEQAISDKKTTPFKGGIVYGFNAVDKIRENANEIASLKAMLSQMQLAMASIASVTNNEDL